MPTGMYRNSDDFAQVDYDGSSIPVSRAKYEKNGYKPDFDRLSREAEYLASQEEAKRRDARAPKGPSASVRTLEPFHVTRSRGRKRQQGSTELKPNDLCSRSE